MDSFITEFGLPIVANRNFQSKINNRMANSVYPNETARYEPTQLDLHRLQMYLYQSGGMKGLTMRQLMKVICVKATY